MGVRSNRPIFSKKATNGFRCLWLFGTSFRQLFERVIAHIFDDPGVIRSGWKQPIAFPKPQRPSANSKYLSRFRLSDFCTESFLLEMLAEGRRLLRNWKTTSPNRRNVIAWHAHMPFTKRQHRALQMEKWPMKARVRRVKFRTI